jgi:predicted TIM-barrel fold metal-dependent hydrolase
MKGAVVVQVMWDHEAVEKLIEFIQNHADLDDLAQLVSLVCVDDRVKVQHSGGYSDPFRNGRRCTDLINRSKTS